MGEPDIWGKMTLGETLFGEGCNLQLKTTLVGRQPLGKDDLWVKVTFGEDNLWGKMTLGETLFGEGRFLQLKTTLVGKSQKYPQLMSNI